jgi:hypothetical protein
MEVKTKERKVIDEVAIILKPGDFEDEASLAKAHKTLDNVFRDVSNGTIKPHKDEISTNDRRRFKVWFNNLTNEEANKIAEYAIRVGIPYHRQFE